MLNKLKMFFQAVSENGRPAGDAQHETHVAAAAMLIQAAMIDGEVDPVERERIAIMVERRLGVPRDAVAGILAESERKAEKAVDIYSFFRVVNEHFEHEERITLIEMLWEVAYADGVLHDHEANLIRKVTGMLGLTDVESGMARKRVLARRAEEPDNPAAHHPALDP